MNTEQRRFMAEKYPDLFETYLRFEKEFEESVDLYQRRCDSWDRTRDRLASRMEQASSRMVEYDLALAQLYEEFTGT